MKEKSIEDFQKMYSGKPRLFCAPGRVNLIGEHTDYNGGFVFPMAIDRFTYVAISKRDDRIISVYSKNYDQKFELNLDNPKKSNNWSDYVFGVANTIENEDLALSGCNIYVYTDVPLGAGLSSSAAIEVSTALALLTINDYENINRTKIALLCQKAENEFVGMKCGIMDQFIACFGKKDHALFLDCRSLDYDLVHINTDLAQIIVCNTMVKHELGASEYNIRRKECEEGVKVLKRHYPEINLLRDAKMADLLSVEDKISNKIMKRCRHVITENERTLQSIDALKNNDLVLFGNLLNGSHESLKNDYSVTCKELDLMVELSRKIDGVYGSRMTGGGFGGCTISLVNIDKVEKFIEEIKKSYSSEVNINPEVFRFLPSEGAREL